MKRTKVEQALDVIVGFLMFGCIFGGIILMMCEVPEFENQVAVTLTGLVLFCIGTIPGVCVSLMASRKEKRNENTYGRRKCG